MAQSLNQKASNKARPMDQFPKIPKLEVIEDSELLSLPLKEAVARLLFIPPRRERSVIPFMSALIFILGLLFWRRQKLPDPSEQCDACGTVFDPEVKCPLCIAMKASQTRLDPKKRETAFRKKWRYIVFKKTVPTFLNVVVPGSGLFLDDADLSGFILVFLTLSLLVLGIFSFAFPERFFQRAGLFVFLGGYYLIMNLFLFKRQYGN